MRSLGIIPERQAQLLTIADDLTRVKVHRLARIFIGWVRSRPAKTQLESRRSSPCRSFNCGHQVGNKQCRRSALCATALWRDGHIFDDLLKLRQGKVVARRLRVGTFRGDTRVSKLLATETTANSDAAWKHVGLLTGTFNSEQLSTVERHAARLFHTNVDGRTFQRRWWKGTDAV